jgi:hypothetical protein
MRRREASDERELARFRLHLIKHRLLAVVPRD